MRNTTEELRMFTKGEYLRHSDGELYQVVCYLVATPDNNKIAYNGYIYNYDGINMMDSSCDNIFILYTSLSNGLRWFKTALDMSTQTIPNHEKEIGEQMLSTDNLNNNQISYSYERTNISNHAVPLPRNLEVCDILVNKVDKTTIVIDEIFIQHAVVRNVYTGTEYTKSINELNLAVKRRNGKTNYLYDIVLPKEK